MKPTKETLTLRRRGEFTIRTKGDNHCGIEAVQQIRYAVEVVCTAELDSRGFLFEQRNVDAFFQGVKQTTNSCEVLSKKCAKKLVKLIMAENPDCEILKITLNLCPAPFAADMTYTMEF